MSSSAEMLELVEAEIVRRLQPGCAVEEHSEGAQRLRLTSIKDLYFLRDQLRTDAALESSGGASFSLLAPLDSRSGGSNG